MAEKTHDITYLYIPLINNQPFASFNHDKNYLGVNKKKTHLASQKQKLSPKIRRNKKKIGFEQKEKLF